jgi:hypothetical protein
MENLRAGFQGKMVATGPILRTTAQIQLAAVDLKELTASHAACTCEYCRSPYIPNHTNPALSPEACR